MLVPLTDSVNPYAAMMLELIAQSKPGAHSHVWNAPEIKAASRRRFSIGRLFGRGRRSLAPSGASSAA